MEMNGRVCEAMAYDFASDAWHMLDQTDFFSSETCSLFDQV